MNTASRPKLAVLAALGAALLIGLAWFLWPRPPAGLPGNDRFGLCFVSSADALAGEARYAGALAAGARWDRWPLYWHWVDHSGYVGDHPGGRHDYDTLVQQEISHGLTPIVILLGTPAGQAQLEQAPVSAASATLPPTSLFEPIFTGGTDEPGRGRAINPANAWASFVFATVERYRPGGELARRQGWPAGAGVRYWEIWNEPDYDLFWRGTVADYRRLLEVAYRSIKAADPEATVLLGGLAFYNKPTWFSELLAEAGYDPGQADFDVFSFHHYLNIYAGERKLTEVRAALDAAGLARVPIWVTESGVSVWDDYPATAYGVGPEAPFSATMAEQAAYIVQNSALAFYHGVGRYYHFMLHDDCGDGPSSAYGLRQNFSPYPCNPAEGRPRPAYAAYQLAAGQFRDLQPLWREKLADQDIVAFYRPDDRARLVALWASQGLTATATITATGETAELLWLETSPIISEGTAITRSLALTPTAGVYTLTLAPATNQKTTWPGDTLYAIGGPPYLLVERDTRPPEVTVEGLLPASPTEFVLRWQGTDSGSGIAGYDVWVSENGGPLRPWLTATLAIEARFTGQVDSTYGFAVRARDRAGNAPPVPGQAQAVTLVAAGWPVPGRVLGPAGLPVAGAVVTIAGPNLRTELVTGADGAWPAVPLPAGVYTFQAAAPGYAVWPAPRRLAAAGPATLTLTLAPLSSAIQAGDFEGNGVWDAWARPHGQLSLSADAFDGEAGVRLGDSPGEPAACPESSWPGQLWTLQQRVTIPTGARPVLSFMVKISATGVTSNTAWLEVALSVGDPARPLAPPGKLWQPTDWTLVSRDLSAWQGLEADLQFRVFRCSELPFAVTLDRVSIGN